jgi:hypothetical protein
VNEDHSLIRNHVKIFTDTQNNLLVRVLWPAVFDETAWQRTSTRRPAMEKEDPANAGGFALGGFGGSGTDKEVRTYENEVWTDNDQVLEVVVTTEHGEFVEVTFNVKWN